MEQEALSCDYTPAAERKRIQTSKLQALLQVELNSRPHAGSQTRRDVQKIKRKLFSSLVLGELSHLQRGSRLSEGRVRSSTSRYTASERQTTGFFGLLRSTAAASPSITAALRTPKSIAHASLDFVIYHLLCMMITAPLALPLLCSCRLWLSR